MLVYRRVVTPENLTFNMYLDPPFGCQISVLGGFFGGSNFRLPRLEEIQVDISNSYILGDDFFFQMGVSNPKIGGNYPPKSSHLFIGFGTIIFTIHFWGTSIFGNTQIIIYWYLMLNVRGMTQYNCWMFRPVDGP